MYEDNERRPHRGSAGWIIVGIVAGLAIIFIVVITFSSTLFLSGPKPGGPSETPDQSATSGPGHNTTTAGGNVPLESQDGAVANTSPGTANPRLRSHLWQRDEQSRGVYGTGTRSQ